MIDLDQQAAPHRRALVAHCYRITGSLADAEDAVQEALVRAWRALPSFEGRSSLRRWLIAIATRTALDIVERRKRTRTMPHVAVPAWSHDASTSTSAIALPPPATEQFLEALPDAFIADADDVSDIHDPRDDAPNPEARFSTRETVTLAFVAALQTLPPKQRGALLLRDVVGCSAEETAEILEMTVAAVNSAVQRARATLSESPQPRFDADPDPAVLSRFVAAFENRDTAALVELLADDVVFTMPPLPLWLSGKANVARFLESFIFAMPDMREQRLIATRANGAPAFAAFTRDPASGLFVPRALDVVHVEGGLIRSIHAFLAVPGSPGFRGFDVVAP